MASGVAAADSARLERRRLLQVEPLSPQCRLRPLASAVRRADRRQAHWQGVPAGVVAARPRIFGVLWEERAREELRAGPLDGRRTRQ